MINEEMNFNMFVSALKQKSFLKNTNQGIIRTALYESRHCLKLEKARKLFSCVTSLRHMKNLTELFIQKFLR